MMGCVGVMTKDEVGRTRRWGVEAREGCVGGGTGNDEGGG